MRALIARVAEAFPLLGGDVVEVAPSIGSAEDARRTTDVAAGYMLETLAAMTGAGELSQRAVTASGRKATTMARPPEDDITQQGDGSAAVRAAWDAFDAGKLETARHRAERLGEDSPEGLFLRAACSREEDDLDGAIALLKRAIAADPEWASPELAFAELLAETPDRLADARKHAERAVELAEEEDEYLSALALKAGLEAEAGDDEAGAADAGRAAAARRRAGRSGGRAGDRGPAPGAGRRGAGARRACAR